MSSAEINREAVRHDKHSCDLPQNDRLPVLEISNIFYCTVYNLGDIFIDAKDFR
jgi:hypothetical protein